MGNRCRTFHQPLAHRRKRQPRRHRQRLLRRSQQQVQPPLVKRQLHPAERRHRIHQHQRLRADYPHTRCDRIDRARRARARLIVNDRDRVHRAARKRPPQRRLNLLRLDRRAPRHFHRDRLLAASNRNVMPSLAERPVDKIDHPPAHSVPDSRLLQPGARRRNREDPRLRTIQRLQLLAALPEKRLQLIAAVTDHRRTLRRQRRRMHVSRPRHEQPLRRLIRRCHKICPLPTGLRRAVSGFTISNCRSHRFQFPLSC